MRCPSVWNGTIVKLLLIPNAIESFQICVSCLFDMNENIRGDSILNYNIFAKSTVLPFCTAIWCTWDSIPFIVISLVPQFYYLLHYHCTVYPILVSEPSGVTRLENRWYLAPPRWNAAQSSVESIRWMREFSKGGYSGGLGTESTDAVAKC